MNHEAQPDSLGREDCADDLLLARAVAGDRAAIDTVCARGVAEPELLQEFARWQADEIRLARAARTLDGVADRVGTRCNRSTRTRSAGLGWAVAAVLALLLFARVWTGAAGSASPGNVAGIAGPMLATSEDAFQAYLDKARPSRRCILARANLATGPALRSWSFARCMKSAVRPRCIDYRRSMTRVTFDLC